MLSVLSTFLSIVIIFRIQVCVRNFLLPILYYRVIGPIGRPATVVFKKQPVYTGDGVSLSSGNVRGLISRHQVSMTMSIIYNYRYIYMNVCMNDVLSVYYLYMHYINAGLRSVIIAG